jgi:hypothetical protein
LPHQCAGSLARHLNEIMRFAGLELLVFCSPNVGAISRKPVGITGDPVIDACPSQE